MLIAQVLGLKYHRSIKERVNSDVTYALKNEYDYSFIVCMGEFIDGDYEVVDKTSCIIDLGSGVDKIQSGFNATGRNELRRSERIDGLRFYGGCEEFDSYYKFYAECEHARGWLPVPRDELRNSMLFTADYHGVPISGMSCYEEGKRLRIGRIYSTRRSKGCESLNNTVYGCAARRIVIEICKYGIEHGYETLDLGGIDLKDKNKSSIGQFKLSLGGRVADVKIGRHMKESFRTRMEEIKERGLDIT